MINQLGNKLGYVLVASTILLLSSCGKLVDVEEPRDSITTEKMFQSESKIEEVLTGIYTVLINGPTGGAVAPRNEFAAALTTLAGAQSSGEFAASAVIDPGIPGGELWRINRSYANAYWESAYNVVYLCNSLMEGIAESNSSTVRDSVKTQYMAEARLIRAFCYLYLSSFFGDVPLVLTADFNQTRMMGRTSMGAIYEQIEADLLFAEENLPLDYAAGKGQRIRVNAWVAKALLARMYLYQGNFDRAATYAGEVINRMELFQLEPLSRVFLVDSREAIFQLMQTNQSTTNRNATPEGATFLPNPLHTGVAGARLSQDLLNQFDVHDQRRITWIDSTLQTQGNQEADKVWYPSKYKLGRHNAVLGAPPSEYYMVIRLAELFLIRAEARAKGADGGATRALADLNVLRNRAGLTDLPADLTPDEVLEAVWLERRKELFAEWGHYWLDLRRSGKASEVLSKIPAFIPWEGDWQLLYPIPESEILVNSNLKQNPGYDEVRH